MPKRLSQDINFPIVLRMQGWLLLIEAAFMLLPLAIAWWFRERTAITAFALSAGITAAAGSLMAFCIKPRSTTMRKREGLLLTAIIWVFFSAFGMLPYLLAGTFDTVTDAFFETMAGFTTTGCSVNTNIDATPCGILFWRSLTQWVGGMGIILFTLAVIPMLNHRGGIALFNAEVTGITHEKLRPRVSQTAKGLWLIYLLLTALLALLLLGPMDWFDAVCHAMSTTSTGGYSTRAAGLAHWQSPYLYVVVTAFMLLGGTNFTLIYALLHGNLARLRHNDVLRCYLLTAAAATVVITLYMTHMGYHGTATTDRAICAAFHTVSALTSTGYTTLCQHQGAAGSGEFVTLILMAMMLVGGMAGSTSGGAKLDRLIILVRNTRNELYRLLHGSTVRTVHIDGKPVATHLVAKVNAFFSIYAAIIVAVALWLTLCGLGVADALATSMSAISNVGIGFGVTATGSWACLPPAAKWALALEMMVGRLELFTVLVIFTRSFWVKD